MPEGDTVHLTAQRMHDALAGRTLERTDLRVPALATVDLAGTVAREVVARGKHLLLRTTDGWSLHSHLGMEGEWRVRKGSRVAGAGHEIRAIVATQDAVATGVRLAQLDLLRTRDEPSLLGHLGPDPLGDDWDPSEAARRLRARPGRAIGDALVDQAVIAGLGNVYRSEICFLRGVDPRTPVESTDVAALLDLAARTLQANRTTGTHVTTGDPRRGRRHWVYGRAGEPCRRCSTPIVRESLGGEQGPRSVYLCPSCQRSYRFAK